MPTDPSAIFVSHGGGPLPVLGDPEHEELVSHLADIASSIQKPSAIIVVSAHWEESIATITAHPNPQLIYDYSGFPPASYELAYPAPGAPALAENLIEAIRASGMEARLDTERGFDHGLFIPLMLMYPDADIPCVQLSLLSSLDPAEHLRLGDALSRTAVDDVLVLGSGFSFHNLRALMSRNAGGPDDENQAFESWLGETCCSDGIDEAERRERLIAWDSAPSARYCHPREEHLLPLHVCYGRAGSASSGHAALRVMNKHCSSYFWAR